MWPRRTVVRWLGSGVDSIGRRVGFGGLAFLLFCMWAVGIADHLFETSMEEFVWTDERGVAVDVRREVKREVSGNLSKYLTSEDWYSVKTIRRPACPAAEGQLPLLIIVKSFVGNANQRTTIRKTWGSVAQKRGARVVFIVGIPREEALMEEVEVEADANDDLLIIDAIDEYRNNTVKLMHALAYQARNMFCGEHSNPQNAAQFLLLIDDDYAISVANLFDLLAKRKPEDEIYEGWKFDTTPFRFVWHKHRVSLRDYPFSQYPPYISAGAVLLSRRTALEFHLAVRYLSEYKFDDVYAGIIANSLGIVPSHNSKFKYDDWSTTIAAHGYNSFALKFAFHKFQELQS